MRDDADPTTASGPGGTAIALVLACGLIVLLGLAAFFFARRTTVQRERAVEAERLAQESRAHTAARQDAAGAAGTRPETLPTSAASDDTSGVSSVAASEQQYAWQSLFDGTTLNNWTVTSFGGEGDVFVEEGTIVMETGSDMTGITYAGDLPKTNYEFALEGMRRDGSDFFCSATFPVGDEPCSLIVGGWGGVIVGLSNVDGRDASDNITTRDAVFENKRWYDVRIRVSDAKVECWIDEAKIVDVQREGHEFGIRPEMELCRPLGICTWQTAGAVRKIQIRRLTPVEVSAAANAVSTGQPGD